MREAFRLNLSSSFWWKASFGNFRILVYLIVLVALIVTKLRGDAKVEWQSVLILVGVLVALLALYLFRLHRAILKKGREISEACSMLTIDGQGLTAEGANGSKAFTPWSAVHRWREGKLVFTIGDAKAFRIVPKSALGEMQSGELRSILQSQIV
jgi:hypothetical protein